MRKRRPVEDFAPAASASVLAFPKAVQPVPARLEGEALRLDQFRRQSEMLAEILAHTPRLIEPANLAKENRVLRHEDTRAAQAERQEKGGSIFSSAYDGRFFGMV